MKRILAGVAAAIGMPTTAVAVAIGAVVGIGVVPAHANTVVIHRTWNGYHGSFYRVVHCPNPTDVASLDVQVNLGNHPNDPQSFVWGPRWWVDGGTDSVFVELQHGSGLDHHLHHDQSVNLTLTCN